MRGSVVSFDEITSLEGVKGIEWRILTTVVVTTREQP